jgi:hypothetical protein
MIYSPYTIIKIIIQLSYKVMAHLRSTRQPPAAPSSNPSLAAATGSAMDTSTWAQRRLVGVLPHSAVICHILP